MIFDLIQNSQDYHLTLIFGGSKQKIPESDTDPGILLPCQYSLPLILEGLIYNAASTWAGLLAPGSSYLLRLPIPKNSGFDAAFVPSYSGGSATVFNRLP